MSRKPASLSKPTSLKRKEQVPNTASHQPKLATYIGFFAVGYILASAVFMIIQTKLALNAQLVTMLSILLGAYISVHKFIKHQKRALYKNEINRLTFGGVMVVWLLTMIYFLGIWLFVFDAISREVLIEMTMQQPLPLMSAFVMILVLSLVSTRISTWAINRLLDPNR